jgi:hypothetical protein
MYAGAGQIKHIPFRIADTSLTPDFVWQWNPKDVSKKGGKTNQILVENNQ